MTCTFVVDVEDMEGLSELAIAAGYLKHVWVNTTQVECKFSETALSKL